MMKIEDMINNVEVYGLDESIIASGYPMSVDKVDMDYEVENLRYYLSINIDKIVKKLSHLANIKLYDYYFSFEIQQQECMLCYEDYELALENLYISEGYLKCSKGYIHKLILSADNFYTDHINKNKLDNRRNNLRLCTPQENTFNGSISSNNTSGVIGVSYRTNKGKWRAYISPNGKQITLGHYKNFDDAVRARLKGELEYFKEFSPQLYLCDIYNVDNPYGNEQINKNSAIKALNHINRTKKLFATHQGEGHDQALTGIVVQFDLTYTVKAWTEAERYHFFDFVSSQSTMHRITKFDLDKSYIEYVDKRVIEIIKELIQQYNDNPTPENYLKVLYTNPCGFKLTARMTTNYRQLKTIYHQRKNHRLPEWRCFCEWIETLPKFKELCLGE